MANNDVRRLLRDRHCVAANTRKRNIWLSHYSDPPLFGVRSLLGRVLHVSSAVGGVWAERDVCLVRVERRCRDPPCSDMARPIRCAAAIVAVPVRCRLRKEWAISEQTLYRFGGRRIAGLRRSSDIRGRRPVAPAKHSIKIRQIIKTKVEGHCADGAIAQARIAQGPISAC